jgi:hypothetical protein
MGTSLGGAFRSTDNGTSWTVTNTGLPQLNVSAFASLGDSTVFVGMQSGGVFRSTNAGITWEHTGLVTSGVKALMVDSSDLFAGTLEGVVRSTDRGTTWFLDTVGIGPRVMRSFTFNNGNLFAAGDDYADVWRSTNRGASWTWLGEQLSGSSSNLVVIGQYLFALTSDGVYRSSDRGLSWTFPNIPQAQVRPVAPLVVGSTLFVVTSEGLYRTTNFGASWEPLSPPYSYEQIEILGASGSVIFKVGGSWGAGGLFFSSDLGTTWRQASLSPQDAPILSIFSHGDRLFAGTYGVPGVWVSTNNGDSWSTTSSGMIYTGIGAFAAIDTMIFAGTGGGVYRSTDNGVNWQPVNGNLPASQIEDFALVPSSVGFVNFFTAIGREVYRSMDTSGWWDIRATLSDSVRAFGVIGVNLFAGTAGGGVFRSSHSGADWVTANGGLTDLHVADLAVIGQDIFAATGIGVFRSTDLGVSWAPTALQISGLQALTVDGNRLYATWYGGGVSSSDDLGASWSAAGNGLKAGHLAAIAVNEAYVFVGSEYGCVWRRPKEDFTGVMPAVEPAIPQIFALEQNYPNPFNPATVIKYTVARIGGSGLGTRNVDLRVYDLLGRQMAVLVNEREAPGTYEVSFDGSNLASGVYIYRLTAGSFVQSRKMLLIK